MRSIKLNTQNVPNKLTDFEKLNSSDSGSIQSANETTFHLQLFNTLSS